jgi:hypothetical protein
MSSVNSLFYSRCGDYGLTIAMLTKSTAPPPKGPGVIPSVRNFEKQWSVTVVAIRQLWSYGVSKDAFILYPESIERVGG